MTRRLPSALLLAALLLCGAAPPMSAQVLGGRDLTPEEGVFLDKIINDYGYTDLARRWIAARKKSAGRVDKATLEFYTVDILRAEGEFEAADAENQRLARLFPGHPRSQGAELEAVQAVMARVLTMHQDALAETNPVARRKLLEERDRLFGSEVLGTLERAIPELEAALKTLRDPDPRRLSQKRAKKQLERDRWEHYRLQALKLYTQRLPEGSDEAAEGWQKLSELAELFVSERYDDFRMQYSAQLILGQALAAQGRSEEAAEALELLVEAEPVTAPPYSPGTIAFMRMLRIQALQGTAEAWNRAGRPERAVEAFDQAREGASRHFPLHADPEHPDLVPFVVLMDVEEAISRAGGGNRGRGVELFHRLIDRFDSPGFRRGDPLAAESYLEDIARGLSRLVDMQVGELGAELCFRAAVGFKLLGRYERAIGAAKQALHSGSGVPADTSWCARALYEIGENSDTLGRIPEAVIAYLALLDTYPQSPVAGDAARNAVALAADLAAAEGGIWRELAADAEKIFAGYSVGLASEQLKLQKGGEAESRGLYDEARRLYLSVGKSWSDEGKRKPVPFYYRARASAGRCLFRKAVASGEAASAKAQVVEELGALLAGAEKEGNSAGAAALRLELAQTHWHEDARDIEAALAALTPFAAALRRPAELREGALHLWVRILIEAARLSEAERRFELLRKDFAGGRDTLEATLELLFAHRDAGTDADLRRAAQLTVSVLEHPMMNMAEQAPEDLLQFSLYLVDGDLHGRAVALLEEARKRAGDNPEFFLEVQISYTFGKAANAAGRHREAVETLTALIERYPQKTRRGEYEEAPYVYNERARARLGLYERSPDGDTLKGADEDLARSLGILEQRRRALRTTPDADIDPRIERDYWNTWLQYMRVWKALDLCERVLSTIRGKRISAGGADASFAPADLQREFDRLEKECGGG